MTLEKQSPNQIVHQEIALDAYLNTLLEGVGLDLQGHPQGSLNSNKHQRLAAADVKFTQPLQEVDKGVEHPDEVPQEVIQTKPVKPLSVMPEWAQSEFQALFFKVDQLILAAPLTELLRTIKLSEKAITKMPGQASWFLGLIEDQNQQIGVLDTGQLLLGKTQGQQRDLSSSPFQRLLITYDGQWGLACDEIISIGKLTTEKVRWRTQRKKRPWLMGTIIDELTAIVDVRQLVPQRKT